MILNLVDSVYQLCMHALSTSLYLIPGYESLDFIDLVSRPSTMQYDFLYNKTKSRSLTWIQFSGRATSPYRNKSYRK